MTNEYKSTLKGRVKLLLDMEDTTVYDDKLDILIDGAIIDLETEGVSIVEDTNSLYFNNYVICIAYKVAMLEDINTDLDRLMRMYISSVVKLREV